MPTHHKCLHVTPQLHWLRGPSDGCHPEQFHRLIAVSGGSSWGEKAFFIAQSKDVTSEECALMGHCSQFHLKAKARHKLFWSCHRATRDQNWNSLESNTGTRFPSVFTAFPVVQCARYFAVVDLQRLSQPSSPIYQIQLSNKATFYSVSGRLLKNIHVNLDGAMPYQGRSWHRPLKAHASGSISREQR